MFYNKEIMEYTPDETEYNRICQRSALFCMNKMIIFSFRDV